MVDYTKNETRLWNRANCTANSGAGHHCDVIMGTMASPITSLTIVYSTVYSGADQRKHQSSASLAFVRGIHRSSVNSPHKCPVTRKMFPFDDVIMYISMVTMVSPKLVPQLDDNMAWIVHPLNLTPYWARKIYNLSKYLHKCSWSMLLCMFVFDVLRYPYVAYCINDRFAIRFRLSAYESKLNSSTIDYKAQSILFLKVFELHIYRISISKFSVWIIHVIAFFIGYRSITFFTLVENTLRYSD